ncbi:MAG: hypothetical protein ABEJ65_09725 [bacterium]
MSTQQAVTETTWEQISFRFSEQLKILLLLFDSLPFRSTHDHLPHRLDLKEASRLTDWPVRHLEWLACFLTHEGLVESGEDRFFWTDRIREWEQDTGCSVFEEDLPIVIEIDDEEIVLPADSEHTKLYLSLLNRLENEQEIARARLVKQLSSQDEINPALEQFEEITGNQISAERLLHSVIKEAYWIGWIDREQDDEAVALRLNDRGESVLEGEALEPLSESGSELPMIAQPDGSLLIPLEAPVEDYRHIHPFTLVVDVDRMMQYRLDKSSLTHAMNQGWDVYKFFQYLEDRIGDLPDPMRMILEDLSDSPESIGIKEVSHVLTFEKGATASEAARLLSNYNPERLDETTLLLRSSTQTETIRKNLSRGGIRLNSDSDETKFGSRLIEVKDESEQD